MLINKILESTRFVVENSKQVKININEIYRFCDELHDPCLLNWLHYAPYELFSLPFRERLHFLVILDAISFCYWPEPKWTVNFRDQTYDGTWALIAALGRAIDNSFPITDFKFLSEISEEDFDNIFLSGTTIQIPLRSERIKILRELGAAISKYYGGDFTNFVVLSKNDVFIMLKLLTKFFPCFIDESYYNGKLIHFFKRAQLLISDLHCLFGGGGSSYRFSNISQLTACADYKLPQVLRSYGMLEYSEELNSKILSKTCIEYGSEDEIEIRANTVWAVEEIKFNLITNGLLVESHEINDFLWLLGQQKNVLSEPYHRVITTSY